MDLQLNQWRNQHHKETESEEEEEQSSPAKIPRHVFDQIHSQTQTSIALPLFVPEPTSSSNLSSLSPDSSSSSPRYMLAGASVPQELLLPIKKSLIQLSPSHFLQHLPLYQPAWYMGRAGMDPEPGRCRRTDGKKWRCSRDVFSGHKYCERHMNRGRNRSRKLVETPLNTATTTTSMAAAAAKSSFAFGGGGGEEVGQGGGGSSCLNFSGSSLSFI
ncbi:unnamed protein product [Cochlearia groenlandica]